MTTGLAIDGGAPAYRGHAPRYPRFSEQGLGRLADVLRAGPTQGLSKANPLVAEFESALAAFHQVPYCLAGSSGHGALQSALIGLEVTDGDEVITSPYSWGASVSCILHNGAMPVFADVDPVTGLLDPESIAAAISDRTRAILVPHLYGQPSDMTAIMAIAERHDLVVVEDGSQAHGAQHAGRPVGSFGHASGFSVNGVKPLATSEGGYMVTRVADVYWKATISGQHAGRGELVGRASEPGFPDELRGWIDSLVYTYRPSVPSMVLALDQLPLLHSLNDIRRANADQLREQLAGAELVSMPEYSPADRAVYHMVTVNVADGFSRDRVLAALQAEGVPAVTYVEKGLHRSPRLSRDYTGPRVMWTATVRNARIDPTTVELPNTDIKVARSIEIPWNYIERDEDLIGQIATALHKLEAAAGDFRVA